MAKQMKYGADEWRRIRRQRNHERACRILQLAADGHTDEEIGQRLHYATDSVKWWLKEIYRDMPARNRTHAVFQALQRGWIT
jgi:DNA-binding NarL/FixJ family response regulator